jgi:hypothetical protein
VKEEVDLRREARDVRDVARGRTGVGIHGKDKKIRDKI